MKDINENFSADISIFEGMTSLDAVMQGIFSGINDRELLSVYFDKAKKEKKARELTRIKKYCEKAGAKLSFRDEEFLSGIATGTTHGGIIFECTDRKFAGEEEFTALLLSENKPKFIAALDGIEDPFNFGYCLRSLYAFGVDCVLLPERNWMTAAGTVCRSSAGASEMMKIFAGSFDIFAEKAKNAGYSIIGTAKENSVSIDEADLSYPLMLVIGGEKRGISKAVEKHCNKMVRIDYSTAFSASLSAASSATVLGYAVSLYNKKNK